MNPPRPLPATALLSLALVAAALALAPLLPRLDWHWRAAATLARVDALLAASPRALPDGSAPAVCASGPTAGHGLGWDLPPPAAAVTLSTLASWQTVGGCGAGASTGGAGGLKWIGRNVRGGLFHVECQANYVDVPEGYQFVGSSLVSADLSPKWNLGASVPYLYKFMYDPFKLGVDLANKGPGDVNLLLTRRLGATNDWSVTASAGLPTGTSDTAYRMQPLKQDLQLGLGKPTASLIVDHTLDNLWGPIVLGGTANWRGGENQHRSYRAPSASVYSYVSYLLGPLAPAAGLSLTRFFGTDRDRGEEQAVPRATLAANFSLEWSTDWIAVLVGTSIPYDINVQSDTVADHNRFGNWWTFSLGVAFAPF